MAFRAGLIAVCFTIYRSLQQYLHIAVGKTQLLFLVVQGQGKQ